MLRARRGGKLPTIEMAAGCLAVSRREASHPLRGTDHVVPGFPDPVDTAVRASCTWVLVRVFPYQDMHTHAALQNTSESLSEVRIDLQYPRKYTHTQICYQAVTVADSLIASWTAEAPRRVRTLIYSFLSARSCAATMIHP